MKGESRHWLLLSRGSSFETRNRLDLSRYTTVGINHVACEMRVDIRRLANYEVLAECGAGIARNSRYLLMPRFPHCLARKSAIRRFLRCVLLFAPNAPI